MERLEELLKTAEEIIASQEKIKEVQSSIQENLSKHLHNQDIILKELANRSSDDDFIETLKEKGGVSLYFTCPGFDYPEHIIIVTLPGDEMINKLGGSFIISVPSLSWSCCIGSWSSNPRVWEKKLAPIARLQEKEYEIPYISKALADFKLYEHQER